eukprot:gnl/TRDRNA2_/TRDRNA2_192128_c0_seq1.p1 gnl/TRDRNA2_/TRDRNA2_192128_c0~~gnl/TRDRNA2_/TRDRNA2_192128_c0_seq1.p1  ORF type:complete len:288 (-),score=49.85 gnl/TRDRNA2_/TRDRNA2_192128_c0_seq1:24-887(-)
MQEEHAAGASLERVPLHDDAGLEASAAEAAKMSPIDLLERCIALEKERGRQLGSLITKPERQFAAEPPECSQQAFRATPPSSESTKHFSGASRRDAWKLDLAMAASRQAALDDDWQSEAGSQQNVLSSAASSTTDCSLQWPLNSGGNGSPFSLCWSRSATSTPGSFRSVALRDVPADYAEVIRSYPGSAGASLDAWMTGQRAQLPQNIAGIEDSLSMSTEVHPPSSSISSAHTPRGMQSSTLPNGVLRFQAPNRLATPPVEVLPSRKTLMLRRKVTPPRDGPRSSRG